MKPTIKINFIDFWPGFLKEKNFLISILSKQFQVVLSDEPDILFYSCYGSEYLKHKGVRVFYSPENIRPDFAACDYAMTFDFLDSPRHFRLPLYAFYIDQRNSWKDILEKKEQKEIQLAWEKKSKFCCMVVSNGQSKKRIDFFKLLSQYWQVDSGGRYMNNVGGAVADKMAFIRDYKFVIAFENSSYSGYTTEKLLDPMLVDSIPVYWGNERVGLDFNPRRFLNLHDFSSEEKLIQEMMAIEKDSARAIQMLCEPIFPGNELPECIQEKNIMRFLISIVDSLNTVVPVATTSKRFLHDIKRKGKIVGFYVNKIICKNFR